MIQGRHQLRCALLALLAWALLSGGNLFDDYQDYLTLLSPRTSGMLLTTEFTVLK